MYHFLFSEEKAKKNLQISIVKISKESIDGSCHTITPFGIKRRILQWAVYKSIEVSSIQWAPPGSHKSRSMSEEWQCKVLSLKYQISSVSCHRV